MKDLHYPEQLSCSRHRELHRDALGSAWTISHLCSGGEAEAAALSSHPAPAAQI